MMEEGRIYPPGVTDKQRKRSDEREEDRKSEGENIAINNKSAIDDQDNVGVKSDTDSFRVEDSEGNSEE